MHVRAVWIAGEQLVELELHGRVETEDHAYELDAKLRRALEPVCQQRGGPVPVLLDFNRLEIAPDQAELFGRVMAMVREEFSSVMARWGSGAWTRQILAVESMRAQHAANLFEGRGAAVEFLRKVQRGEILASHRSSVPPPSMRGRDAHRVEGAPALSTPSQVRQ